MSTKRKIIFAAVDIGWRIDHYSKFLKKLYGSQIEIKSFVKHKVSKQQYSTSYSYQLQYEKYPSVIQWLYSLFFFLFALTKFDTFYFLSGETLLTRKLRKFEFYTYKLFNKRIVMHFVGSDIRDPNYILQKEANILLFLNGEKSNKSLSAPWQKKLIDDSLKFADKILVSTPDLINIIPSATYYPVLIDLDKLYSEFSKVNVETRFFSDNKIKVLHAPSNIKTKGSTIISSVLKQIEKETGLIEFIYTKDLNRNTGSFYTVSRYELFQLYKEADIVIDQLIVGWYGLQAIEALLAGCTVICYIEKSLKSYLFEDTPIVSTDAANLKEDILNLISKWESNENQIKINKEWVKNHHSIEANHKALIEAINL